MKLPRLSIAKLMALVLAFSIDLALLRAIFYSSPLLGQAVINLLVMVNVQAFAAYRCLSRLDAGRFNGGFLLFGVASALGFLGCVRLFPETMTAYMGLLLNPLEAFFDRHVATAIGESDPGLMMVVTIPFFVLASAFAALPQLVIASVGGWLANRWSLRLVCPGERGLARRHAHVAGGASIDGEGLDPSFPQGRVRGGLLVCRVEPDHRRVVTAPVGMELEGPAPMGVLDLGERGAVREAQRGEGGERTARRP